MRHFLLIAFLIVIFQTANAQLSPGEWDIHLSMNETFKVVGGSEKIYYLSEAGIVIYDKTDNSIEQLSKLDGLSEAEFSTIAYNKHTKSLIIAYQSSCIDILQDDGRIIPIADIKRKYIPGDKAIYNIYCEKELCYLACGFGIVVIDISKQEIKDTYRIGENGNNIRVNDIAVINNKLYAVTEEGIKWAMLDGTNLLDYSNWNTLESEYLPNREFGWIKEGNNTLFLTTTNIDGQNTESYYLGKDEVWHRTFWNSKWIYDFQVYGDTALFATRNGIKTYVALQEQNNLPPYSFLSDQESSQTYSVIKNGNDLWIADKNYGAIRYNLETYEQIKAIGPINNSIFSLTIAGNKLWITKGGFDKTWTNTWQKPLIQSFENGEWNYLNKENLNITEELFDTYLITAHPKDPNHIYVSFYGYGLLEIKDNKLVNWFDKNNSTLSPVRGKISIRVGGMDFDNDGNLWVTCGIAENNLHKLSPDGKWTAYMLEEITNDYNVGKVLVTKNQDIWIIVPKGSTNGLYVMSNDGSMKKSLNVTSFFSNGDESLTTPMNNVYDIAEDHDGEIWVATNKGITTYRNPNQVFNEDPFYAYQPGIDENDGIYHALLENEIVTCILVDGANQKWCGTANSGIFLISEDGEQELAHYDINNSPLLSNSITSLAYNESSGELFIGSAKGLVIYKTNSKGGFATYENIYAYPNPVRENYNGDIYISGLIEDTNVKITTITGRLVYETSSLGGQAVWDGNDLAGNRVHTGIYMVFCATDDGIESAVTKILFIR